MTTPINTFQDIIDAMERNPRLREEMRRQILGEEILQLPAQFRVFLEAAAEIRDRSQRVESRLETLETGQAELRAGQEELRAGQEELRADVTQLKADVRRIDGRLDRGFGAGYESKVTANLASILGQRAGLRRARILKGPGFRTDPNLEDLLEAAESSGVLTAAETDDLLLLDIIAAAVSRQTSERVYAAVEASITAGDDDINRAAERAATLRKLSNTPVTAVLVAETVSETQRQLAASRGVAVMLHPQ